MITFSKRSIFYKLYELVYGSKNRNYRKEITSNMPDNLCTYFWKCFFAFLYLIFLGWLWLPAYLFRPYRKNYGIKHENANISRAFCGFLLYAGIILLYSAVAMWIPNLKNESIIMIGILFYTMIGFLVLIISINLIRDKIRESKKGTYEHKPNLIIEFFKAKKAKYCPKITFK